MKLDLDQLTEDELIDLNHRVVERLRLLEQMRAHGAMMQFSIGQRVSFDSDGRSVSGVLTRYNKKTVTVISDDGRRWNVSPGLLRAPEEKDITPSAAKVIPMRPRS